MDSDTKQLRHCSATVTTLRDGLEYLKSYDTIVAAKIDGTVYLFPDWTYSSTTLKHVRYFLGTYAKETRTRIESGEFVFVPTINPWGVIRSFR